MDMHELARQIAREVLAQLGSAPVVNGARPAGWTSINTPIEEWVMVLGERGADLVARVTEALGTGAGLIFFGEDAGSRPLARHILPFLSCADMADLACGRASGRAAEKALQLLLSGVRVYVLEFEYKSYRETAPSSLYALYEGHKKTLAAYGLIEWFKKRESWHSTENLITEKHVLEAGKSGSTLMVVPIRAIVTPLAIDAARKFNMVFEKR